MRILIVDDAPRKYQALVQLLEREGIPGSDVVIVVSADAARRELAAKVFDLMVLDILLPLRETEEPDYQNSVDLLIELIESDDLKRPPHIVGITADPDAALKASPIFAEQLWTIIEFNEANNEWHSQIRNCAVYIREAAGGEGSPDFGLDLAVVCALQDPELQQVLTLPWNFSAARPIDEHLFVHDGSFNSGGRTLRVSAVACPRMGLVSAALTASRVIRLLRPRIIVMTGICAGIQNKVSLGDVIFIDPAWDWQSGKYLRELDQEAHFLISPHQVGPNSASRAFADQLKTDRPLLSGIADAAPDPAPNVLKLVIGPVASGAAVVADRDVVLEIKAQHRDAAGIEMEAYGFFVASEGSSSPRPIAVAFKAVCDFADALKNDKHQRYASYTSARVMAAYMERYAASLIDNMS